MRRQWAQRDRGVVSDNYVASINGLQTVAAAAAFGTFYTGSAGTVQASYTNNINMNTGRTIKVAATPDPWLHFDDKPAGHRSVLQ